MLKIIKRIQNRLANHNYRVLWAEAVVWAVIIGAGIASWPGVIVLLVALTLILNRQWGQVYLIGLFSCAWGFLVGMIGFGMGGWAWATMLVALAFISGVKIHCRDLKRPFGRNIIVQISNEPQQNWRWGRHS